MPPPDWSSIQEGNGGADKPSRSGARKKKKNKAKQIQKGEKIDKEIKRRKIEIKNNVTAAAAA